MRRLLTARQRAGAIVWRPLPTGQRRVHDRAAGSNRAASVVSTPGVAPAEDMTLLQKWFGQLQVEST